MSDTAPPTRIVCAKCWKRPPREGDHWCQHCIGKFTRAVDVHTVVSSPTKRRLDRAAFHTMRSRGVEDRDPASVVPPERIAPWHRHETDQRRHDLAQRFPSLDEAELDVLIDTPAEQVDAYLRYMHGLEAAS